MYADSYHTSEFGYFMQESTFGGNYAPDCSHIQKRLPGARRVSLNSEGPLAYIAYVVNELYFDGPSEIDGYPVIYRLAS